MKLVSIADLAIFNIQSENILYLKTYDTIINHYIFLNKDKIIKELIKNIDEKFEFEIKDIKII